MIFNNGIHVVANVVIAARAGKDRMTVYTYKAPNTHGMDVTITYGPHLGKSSINRRGTVVRSHLSLGILIHAVNGNSRRTSHRSCYINGATNTHGVDFALGIRCNVDDWMLGIIAGIDVCIVQRSKAVFVDV